MVLKWKYLDISSSSITQTRPPRRWRWTRWNNFAEEICSKILKCHQGNKVRLVLVCVGVVFLLSGSSFGKDGSFSCTYQVQLMEATRTNFLLAARSRWYSVVTLFEGLIKKIFRTFAIRNNLITFPCTAKVNVRLFGCVRLLVL